MGERKGGEKKHPRMFSVNVSIPGTVFYSRELSDRAKLLYGLLIAMSTAPKYYCWAHNQTMADYLRCSDRSVERALDELVKSGEIKIEDNQGGRQTERKIICTRVQPFNPDSGVGVNPDSGVGVPNNGMNNNNKKRRAEPAQDVAPAEWLRRWVTDMELPMETATALIADIEALLENRAQIKKPMRSVQAAKLLATELDKVAAKEDYPIPAMRYSLRQAVLKNWLTPYPIKDNQRGDFELWLISEGIARKPEPTADNYRNPGASSCVEEMGGVEEW